MMTKGWITKIVLVVVLGCGKFHETQGRGCCAGVWLYWGYSENALH